MSDKELFMKLLENKEKYKVYVDNDYVSFALKEDLQKAEEDYNYEYEDYRFKNYGYELLNEVFQALGIDSDLV